MTDKTITEKILSRKSDVDARAGDYVEADVDVMLTHDVTGPLTFDVFEEVAGEDPVVVIGCLDAIGWRVVVDRHDDRIRVM